MNKPTCFTWTTLIVGLLFFVGTMQFYFHWQWAPAITAMIAGGFLLFGLFMFMLVLMSLFL